MIGLHQTTAARRAFATAVVLAFVAVPRSTSAANMPPVIVALRPAAAVRDRVVTIGDVAEVRADDPATVAQISQIDIADPPIIDETVSLTRDQISIRLLLAGLSQRDFQVVGASQTIVTRVNGRLLEDDSVLSVVRSALAREINKPASDLHLHLLRPIRLVGDYDSVAPHEIRLEPRLPANPRTSSLSVKLGIHVRGRLHEVTTVSLGVKINSRVPVAQRDMDANETLTQQNLAYEIIPVDFETAAQAAEDVLGKRSRRQLKAGEIVKRHDVSSAAQLQKRDVLIRPRDVVSVVARRGGLQIRLKRAEALDVGRQGDTIRLRNLDSQQVIRGRVASSQVVELPF